MTIGELAFNEELTINEGIDLTPPTMLGRVFVVVGGTTRTHTHHGSTALQISLAGTTSREEVLTGGTTRTHTFTGTRGEG
jgi:hypothetical protein